MASGDSNPFLVPSKFPGGLICMQLQSQGLLSRSCLQKDFANSLLGGESLGET